MTKSSKTKKDFLREDLLKDPYKVPSLNEYGDEEQTMELQEALKETKPEREKAKARFNKIRKMLGE
jgi:type II restriction/modification system DNA methylase subunit YeeA